MFWMLLSILLCKVLVIGTDVKKELPKWRRNAIKASLRFCGEMTLKFHVFFFAKEI